MYSCLLESRDSRSNAARRSAASNIPNRGDDPFTSVAFGKSGRRLSRRSPAAASGRDSQFAVDTESSRSLCRDINDRERLG